MLAPDCVPSPSQPSSREVKLSPKILDSLDDELGLIFQCTTPTQIGKDEEFTFQLGKSALTLSRNHLEGKNYFYHIAVIADGEVTSLVKRPGQNLRSISDNAPHPQAINAVHELQSYLKDRVTALASLAAKHICFDLAVRLEHEIIEEGALERLSSHERNMLHRGPSQVARLLAESCGMLDAFEQTKAAMQQAYQTAARGEKGLRLEDLEDPETLFLLLDEIDPEVAAPMQREMDWMQKNADKFSPELRALYQPSRFTLDELSDIAHRLGTNRIHLMKAEREIEDVVSGLKHDLTRRAPSLLTLEAAEYFATKELP